jgi:sugar phosphate isomerase/epimerase
VSVELGIATPAVPREPDALDDAFCRWAAGLGVGPLGTHLADPERLAAGLAREVRARLADHGLRIVQATAYNPNMVQPDPDERRASLDRLALAFRVARDLGCPMVLSGCGSLHPSRFYGPHPDNHAPATRERLISFLREAAPRAEDAGIVLALECHLLTTLESPARIREIVAAVDSPWVKVNFDPVNLLGSPDAAFASGAEMERQHATLAPYYHTTAHAKDVALGDDLVLHIEERPCGEGVLDWGAYLRVADRLGAPASLLIEHFPAETVGPSLALLRGTAAEVGVEIVR